MNPKHLTKLELPKILDRLAAHCSFSASDTLARALEPSTEPGEVKRRLAETTQARQALDANDNLGVGGARDVRPQVSLAVRGGVLEAVDLLNIRDTLEAGRVAQRALLRYQALYPQLTAITNLIEPCGELVAEIRRIIDDNGEVRDDASPELARVRREVRVVHDRLVRKLQAMVGDGATALYLQDAIVTQRGGRYVIPVKADFKGRIPGVIHDQSASGLTLFIEPLATLELNNEWRELQLAEVREVNRVLMAVSARVAEEAGPITRVVEALADFDLALAKAKYGEATRSVAAAVVSGAQDAQTVRLTQARHPLLNPETVVPIDVAFETARVLVITGPNTGGKTVALKTIGLLSLMTQCGLHVPAAAAALPVFDEVFADIGDEQSIEQSLSTFSSHLTNLTSFLNKVDARTLVLLDELGAGTDPIEGAALARSILEHLLGSNALCVVATHYPELKAWAYLTDGAVNASVAFDFETLRPLYILTVGLPGRSNAFAIAQRLGIAQSILDRAAGYIDGSDARAETLLAEIAHEQRLAVEAREAARRAQREAEANADRIRARLSAMDDERKQVLDAARDEGVRETDALRAEIRRLRGRVVAAGGSIDEIKRLEQEAEAAQTAAVQAAAARRAMPATSAAAPTTGNQPRRPLRAGDPVRVKTLNANGVISAIYADDLEVQIGALRTRVKLNEIERLKTADKPVEPIEEVTRPAPRAEHVGMELDLRGLNGEEAMPRVEDYLDRAARAGLPFVRLIHGKGTGMLRKAIRAGLKGNPLIKSMETGLDGEGGDGVTVVKFKAD